MASSRASPSFVRSRSQQQSTFVPTAASNRLVKCTKCAGQGSMGFFICKSHCPCCEGTGEASKKQLLQLLEDMDLGDVDAAVVLHAASAEKRDDTDIVLAAVGRFPKAIQFASERLKASQEVIDTAAAADAALQKDMQNRSMNVLNRSHISTFAGATGSTSRMDEVPEVAAEWGSFSKDSA